MTKHAPPALINMGRPKKHHYVPQFLLRSFVTMDGTRLYVFDKRTDRVFLASVADVAAENRLYEFSFGDQTATIEPSLADFESKAAGVLREVLRNDNLADLTVYQRVVLSGLVAQLLLRSPQQRAVMRHINVKLRQRVWAMGTDPDLLPQLRVLDKNEEKLFTASVLPDLMEQFIPVISEKAWILHSVPEDETLYISDNPVAMHNELKFDLRGNVGLAVEGVEVYLPISRRRCLGMYCPSVRSEIEAAYEEYQRLSAAGRQPLPPSPPEEAVRLLGAFRTGKCSSLPKVSIEFVNSLQVWNAERYVYSAVDDFALAREMLARNLKLRRGPRPEVS
jgi:hypothetical protein